MSHRFTLLHVDALIELLSAVDNRDLITLGLGDTEIARLEEVYEIAHDTYEATVGRPHPLASPSRQDDAEVQWVRITNQNPGSVH